MPSWVHDDTGYFISRPHYAMAEIEALIDTDVSTFQSKKYGRAKSHLDTDDLVVLIESKVAELDMYAFLPDDEFGEVLGETVFKQGGPIVRISEKLSVTPSMHHRLRFTLAHEYGHVVLHNGLFADNSLRLSPHYSQSQTPLRAYALQVGTNRWMEFQANYAGGAALMPARALRQVIEDFNKTSGFFVSRFDDGSAESEHLVTTVSQQFEVSKGAARVRLKQTLETLTNARSDERTTRARLAHCSKVLRGMDVEKLLREPT